MSHVRSSFMTCMYHSCNLRICVGRRGTCSGLTRGSPGTYFHARSALGISVPARSSATLRPRPLAISLHASISSCYSWGTDCTSCVASWGTVFPTLSGGGRLYFLCSQLGNCFPACTTASRLLHLFCICLRNTA